MNVPLIMALLAGRHRHRYKDSSGNCSACGKEHFPHNWQDGQCVTCGYAGCEHTNGWVRYNSTQHKCKICGHRSEHVRGEFLHGDIYCQNCQDCAIQFKHSFSEIVVFFFHQHFSSPQLIYQNSISKPFSLYIASVK